MAKKKDKPTELDTNTKSKKKTDQKSEPKKSAKVEESKVKNILGGIWDHYCARPDALPDDYRAIAERDGLEQAVTDYVSGMTDDYAIEKYGEIFIPMAWGVK